MSIAEKLMTAEEFWAQYADQRYELIRGAVLPIVPSEHSHIPALLAASLVPFVMKRDLGRVKLMAHYALGTYTTRVADVSFLSQERQAQIPDKTKYIPFAPELAIEIISPSETVSSVRDKMNDYRTAGTDVMWLVYPDVKEVKVHYLQRGQIAHFSEDDTLTLEEVLSGFELPLKQVFVD